MCFIECHAHTDRSNIRLLDSTNKIEDLILKSAELGLKGQAITDHESLSAHFKALKIAKEFKEQGKIPQDFKIILGNEIYLVDSLEEVKDNYQSGVTKFPHFILLAKNAKGHEALRKLSSMAWGQSFYTGMMERVPTTKKQLEEVLKEYPDSLIGSSACLGSESSIKILEGELGKAEEFLLWCKQIFGKGNFFLELQPAITDEQITVNKSLILFKKKLEIPTISTSDVHFLRPEDRNVHSAYLTAKEGEREVFSFYDSCYLHTPEEIYEKMDYLPKEEIDEALKNTLLIGEMVEDYSLEQDIIIPRIELPEFTVQHLFSSYYDRYKYIEQIANSESEQDRFYFSKIEEGFLEKLRHKMKTEDDLHEVLERIDVELEQFVRISEKIGQDMSSYYVTVSKIVELMWADDCGEDSFKVGSLVGSGRGSAVAFLTNYLTGITQLNPMAYGFEIPYWRHLHHERGDISSLDIDLDVSPSYRPFVYQRIKQYFGENRFLQVCTFGTEGSKSAIQTACRGLGIDSDIAQHISSLIPFERGQNYSILDCLEGNPDKERKKVPEFIREIEKYPRLKETALKLEGLVNKRSIHAGGVIITNDDYIKTNAMMKAPNGTPVTQFNLDDTQAMGSIKYDVLGVSGVEKIQVAMNLMLDNEEVEKKPTLRETFEAHFHPEIINKEDPKLFELVSEGKVPDLFQFSTSLAMNMIKKAKPSNLIELASTNSIMRLMADGEEQPIDIFIRYKNDINLWYEDMVKFGLSEDEIQLMRKHLEHLNGVADTQESAMLMGMDEQIAGLTVTESNILRKSIAKRSGEALDKARKLLFGKGKEQGTTEALLSYVWNIQIARMLGYAFSQPHVLAYTLIAMIQLNMFAYYNPLYWQTACLIVNSGASEVDAIELEEDEEESKKQSKKNYDKVAKAIGELKSFGVKVSPPDINLSKFGFYPDLKNDRILLGLTSIAGIGEDIAHEIIANQPYSSFDDAYERLYKQGSVQKGQFVKLIKSGCFDSFDDREDLMMRFVFNEIDVKEKLTMANAPKIIQGGLLPKELQVYGDMINFRKAVSKNVFKTVEKPKDTILQLNDREQSFLIQHYGQIEHSFENNKMLISKKELDKLHKVLIQPLAEALESKELVKAFNKAQFYEVWDSLASGTREEWEMSTITFYSDKHELDYVDLVRYGVLDFNELSPTPIVAHEKETKRGVFKKMETYTLAGTVIGKDKNKHTISLLTPTGVVTCKMYGGSFSHYDKQTSKTNSGGKKTVVEKSWFTRGSLLLVHGFRRDDQFVLKTYNDSQMKHTINKIIGIDREKGAISLQSERLEG